MRRSAAISLVLLTAIALPGVAGASHKPGHGPGAAESLTIGAKPNPVVYGGGVSIEGTLTSAAKAGKSVILESDAFPYDNVFANVGSSTTAPSGKYSFTQKPGLNTRYRVRQGNLLSPFVTVLVRIRLGLRVSDRTPDRGERVRFFGRACPEHVGALVRIQRRAGGRWATVARTRTKVATRCSSYSRRARVSADGVYRTVVVGDDDHARGVSPQRFIDVD
ncbi:MAG TPA: hypothetical protein VEX36_04805 [Thermoleophilaceae bacterium]|nr:hypothetical protein [Thermoleophilaceae bacterium]